MASYFEFYFLKNLNVLTILFYNRKVMIYSRVCSLCCVVYWFWQIYKNMISPLQYMQNSFTALKVPHASTSSFHFSPLDPWHSTGLFNLLIVLPLPKCHIIGIMQYIAYSDWLFHFVICTKVSSLSLHSMII